MKRKQNVLGVTTAPSSAQPNLPELPLAAWEDSKRTLHLYAQIIGKIRMALHPKLNHWWHVPLYVSPRGLTAQAIPAGDVLIVESAYLAGATHANWDVEALRHDYADYVPLKLY